MSDQTPLAGPQRVTPEQATTLLQLGAIVVGFPVLVLIWIGWLEVATLRDDKPGNHITASLRAAFRKEPGAFGLLVVWIAFLVGLAAFIAGHVFWGIAA